MPHFFASDLIGVSIALILGLPLILLPGYGLGWFLNLFGFRSLPVNARWSLAPVLGLAMSPILLYAGFRMVSVHAMWGIAVLLGALGFCAYLRNYSLPDWRGVPVAAKVVAFSWLALCVGLMLDVAIGSRLYPSTVIIDTSFRSQVITSLANSTYLPAPSYFFYPGREVVLRYHYIYFLIPALMVQIGHGLITSGMALVGLSFWTGAAMFGVVAAVIRFFWTFQNPQRATTIAWGLLGVGGLDLFFSGSQMLQRWLNHEFIFTGPDVGLWNGWGSAFSWLSTALWSPHHLGGLMAGILGCLLLWHSRAFTGWPRWSHAFAAGLAFSTLVGTSVYVSVIFAIFLTIVAIELFLNASRYLPPLIVAGVVGILVVLPFLLDVRPSPDAPAFFSFQARAFLPITLALSAFGVHSRLVWNLSYLAALPITYLVEFGIFFLGGAWWLYKRRELSPEIRFRDHLIVGLGAISIILPSLVWSGMEISNDLGYRGILPAQFLLLFCTTEFLDQQWGRSRIAKPARQLVVLGVSCLVVGVGTNLLEVVILRGGIGPTSSGSILAGEMFRNDHSAERLAQLRTAYTWIRQNTPADALIQENPLTWQMVPLGQYSQRRTVVYGSNPSYLVGQDHTEYLETLKEVRSIFAGSTTLGTVMSTCGRFGLNYVVLQRGDDQWSSPTSYIPQLRPVFFNESVLVFECSSASGTGRTR